MRVNICLHDFCAKLNRVTHFYLSLAILVVMIAPGVATAGSGVIIMYHRIGEEAVFPSTSVTKEQFEAHVSLLEKQKYTVLPLKQLVRALQSGEAIQSLRALLLLMTPIAQFTTSHGLA